MRILKASSLALADVVLEMLRSIAPNHDEGQANESYILVSAFKTSKVTGYIMHGSDEQRYCQVFGHAVEGQIVRVTFGKANDFDHRNGHALRDVTMVDYRLSDAHAAALAIIQWISYGEIV